MEVFMTTLKNGKCEYCGKFAETKYAKPVWTGHGPVAPPSWEQCPDEGDPKHRAWLDKNRV